MDRQTLVRTVARTIRIVRETEDLLERIHASNRREAELVARSHQCIESSVLLVRRVGRALRDSPFVLPRVEEPEYLRFLGRAGIEEAPTDPS